MHFQFHYGVFLLQKISQTCSQLSYMLYRMDLYITNWELPCTYYCITTGTTVTVYMFVHTFLCIYAKSLLLMARAANLLSLHFLLAFKYLSLHCFFNDIHCGSTERSGCTLTFTDVESVCTILLTVVFNSIHTQVHGFKWSHEGMPQTKSPGNGCVNIVWRGYSILQC